jgi:hypothetical protein
VPPAAVAVGQEHGVASVVQSLGFTMPSGCH